MDRRNWLAPALVLLLCAAIVWQYLAIARLRSSCADTPVVPQVELDGGTRRAEVVQSDDEGVELFGEAEGLPMDDICEDAEQQGATVAGVVRSGARTRGKVEADAGSDIAIPREGGTDGASDAAPADPYGYATAAQVKRLSEPVGDVDAPIGEVEFRAWEPKPWTVRVMPRTYSASTALARNEDTGQVLAYTTMRIEVDGKTYVLPVTESRLVENAAGRFAWNPRLHLSVGAGAAHPLAVAAHVGVALSLASYGASKASPAWTFAHIGGGYSLTHNQPLVLLVPAAWNIGKPIPLIDNLHLGPAVTFDLGREIAVTLQLSAAL